MRGLKAWAAAAALAGLAPAGAQAQMVEGVAAIVNDEVISTYDVRQRALLLLASSGIEVTPENQTRAGSQALRDLVDERLQLQEAEEFNVDVTQDTIDRSISEIARQNRMTSDQFQQQLAEGGVGMPTLRQQIRAETAWRRLINGMYGSRIRISDQQIRDMQQRIIANASRDQYQASEIVIPANSESEFAEAEMLATRLLEEMSRGAPFPLVARQFSASPSAAAGGDLGWLAAGEMRAEFIAALDRLQPGQVSTPFRTQDAVYILALRDRRVGNPAVSAERISLRQIAAPAASRNDLDRARRRIANCEGLETVAGSVQGGELIDLGIVTDADLSEEYRAQIAGIGANQTSGVAVSGARASIMVVCSRETSVDGMPSRTEVENRLFEQELALLAQRYLRNLRREATIIQR